MTRRTLKFTLIASLAASPTLAEPMFENRSDALPSHSYTGEWEHFVGGGVGIFDCNGDDLPDLFAAGGATPARLMVNQGDFTFKDQGTFATGVTGAYPIDIDSDGHLDLAVMRVGANQLLKGDGACGFKDASDAWGFDGRDRWTTAFTAAWTKDGWTMMFGNYVNRDDPDGPFGTCDAHTVHRQTETGFDTALFEPGFCTLSALISDWQRSGTPMLRISNDRHYHQDKGFEQMLTLGDLKTVAGWPETKLWGMGIASGDITGDGLPEVMLSSMGDQLMQMNDGTTFSDAPYDIGTFATTPHTGPDTKPSTGWHTEFADIDNDADLDLFIAKGNVEAMEMAAMNDPNNLLVQGSDGTFTETAATAGIATFERSRGAGLADFDRDGRLDLVVMNRNAEMELYRNVTKDTGNWLHLKVRGTGGNTFAVGAWVEVKTPSRTQAREITIGGGHASGQIGDIHVGLGAAETAQVRVIWPGGAIGDWQTVTANQTMTISPAT